MPTVWTLGYGSEWANRARERVGRVLRDKWRLDQVLGVGGSAAVYAATHRNGKRVAIKILHPELSREPEVTSRFLREGYLANRVGHPGVVSVLDDEVTEDGLVFQVMELLEGETLQARWVRKGKRLELDEVLGITDALLDVLAAAHTAGVVHRDLKPANVFITREGALKVLDFGIARLHELPVGAGGTHGGTPLGTPAFMAPEQARARWELVDAQTDLWAVGAAMFMLLCGRYVHEPEESATVSEQITVAMTTPAPRLCTLRPELPAEVAEIVDRALAFDKASRWSDARTMQVALRQACTEAIGCSPELLPRPQVPQAAAPVPNPTTLNVWRQAGAAATDEPATTPHPRIDGKLGGPEIEVHEPEGLIDDFGRFVTDTVGPAWIREGRVRWAAAAGAAVLLTVAIAAFLHRSGGAADAAVVGGPAPAARTAPKTTAPRTAAPAPRPAPVVESLAEESKKPVALARDPQPAAARPAGAPAAVPPRGGRLRAKLRPRTASVGEFVEAAGHPATAPAPAPAARPPAPEPMPLEPPAAKPLPTRSPSEDSLLDRRR